MEYSVNLIAFVLINGIFLSEALLGLKKSETNSSAISLTNDDYDSTETLSPNSPINKTKTSCSTNEALHSPSQTCYEIGSQGPCNDYERWYAKSEEESEGECTCLMMNENCGNLINRPIARSIDDGHCYPVYSKANCQGPNEWFTFRPNSLSVGHCTRNPCTNVTQDKMKHLNETSILGSLGFRSKPEAYPYSTDLVPLTPFWFLYKDKCVQSFTKGTCNIVGKKDPGMMLFRGTKPVPECAVADGSVIPCFSPQILGLPTRENSCPFGYKKVGKDCTFSVTIESEDYKDDE